jgi:DNA-binding GntR family transcriptional regulator
MAAEAEGEIRVEYRPIRDQVYESLLKMIVHRKVLPGERLVVDDLAARFEVSNTPVQYALSRLAAERLVKPAGRRGYCVTVPTAEELREIYDMRLMCERHSVEYGIASVTPESLALMRAVAEEYVRHKSSTDPNAVYAGVLRDREFHRLVVALNGNQMAIELYDRLSFHIQTSRLGLTQGIALDERLAKDHAEHLAIVAALELRDVEAAKRAVHDHITRTLHRRLATLQGAGAP